MLIVPLHRPLTLASFPVLTALLMLANLAVFVLLQSGDDAARARAFAYYAQSGLAAREQPAYLAQLPEPERTTFATELEQAPEPLRPLLVSERIADDSDFLAALDAGAVPDFDERWRQQRDEYEALRSAVFTDRHVQRYDRLDPAAAFSAAFLHGNAGHLFGNLLFLALLGLLVEPVLGAWRMLGLYLGGAFGAALAGWAWNWGDAGAVLGASGAIAALMGACSVLWAGRRVRVFYWFFVLFDYVRVPALLLLPLWLGWELLQLAAYGDSAGVAFDAHAGGLVTGGAIALGLRRAGWWNPAALDEDTPADDDTALLRRAQVHLGRMDTLQADRLLDGLAERQPASLPVCLARFRSARLAGAAVATVGARGQAVLACTARNHEERQLQADALAELDAAGIAVPLPARLALLRRLLAAGEPVATLLEPTLADPAAAAAAGPLAQAWLELGVALHDRGDAAGARHAWETVADRFGSTPQAAKARFLLEQHAATA